MKQQMCSRCGERPAVVFIQKMENDKVTPEGLCIKCARELNIGSINQMIDKLGISDEEIEAASEQMADFMENMGDFNLDNLSEMFNPENFDGAQTMPFSDLINGALSPTEDGEEEITTDNSDSQPNGKNAERVKEERRMIQENSSILTVLILPNVLSMAKLIILSAEKARLHVQFKFSAEEQKITHALSVSLASVKPL